MDIEDATAAAGEIRREEESCIGSLDMKIEEESIRMSRSKADLIEMATITVQRCMRNQEVDCDEDEARTIAAMQVELGAAHVVELFSPKRFTAAASRFGLRPGFAVDLCEPKPYGPHEGQNWDLNKKADVEELEEMVDFEQPTLLSAGPPCETFSTLRRLSDHKRPPEKVQEEKRIGRQHLRTSIKFYRKQYDAGRYFLHEHPFSATSWQDEEMVALQRLPGVYTVDGPMCRFDLEVNAPGRGTGVCYKRTKWVTNSRKLAEALDGWCTNQTGGPYHVHMQLIGGIAHQAAAYPPKLVKAVLTALKAQMLEDGSISDMDLKTGGPVPSKPVVEPWAETPECWEEIEKFFDNISGEELPTQLVKEARKIEIDWCRSLPLYTKVPRTLMLQEGHKAIPTRWVDVNKGDRSAYNVRSRICGKELKAKTKETLLAHELFSAMPPWEIIKTLLSLLVTSGVDPDGEELEMGIFDISRAHFMPKASRRLFIEIPEEDRKPSEGDIVGLLERNMYGFRDASKGWQEDWQKLLEGEGYQVGKANPALFLNAEMKSKGAVHGDDFYVLGPRRAVDHIGKVLGSKYSVRESHRLGFGDHCTQTATVLNRVVTLGDEHGRRFVQIEPDARHVELILLALGLEGPNVKTVATPGIKSSDARVAARKEEPDLTREEASMFRSCCMRGSFLSQDRGDIGEAIKSLAQQMARPTKSSMEDLKRLGRYLKGRPSMALRFSQQDMPKYLRVSVDSDFAGDRSTRKSTTGMVQRFGNHTIKTTSNLQSSVGLNVSECEFYALVHGAAHGLGMQAFLRDIGIDIPLVVESDSTSAKSFASRKGLGKQRHVQTRYLWIQDRVAAKSFEIRKVCTHWNVSDVLTKTVTRSLLDKHLEMMGFCDVDLSLKHKHV